MAMPEQETESEGTFTNDRGYKIFCKYWSKQLAKPRALLFICHGLAEHCLPYTELAEKLTDKGFYVFGHDHQGHGQSEGTRNYIKDLRHYIADVFKHIDTVKEQFPDLPVLIIGHSMGGAVTTLAGLDRPDYFKAVALLGPVVTPDPEAAGPVRVFFGKILARVIPQMPVLWLKDEELSHDKAVCQKTKDDPLNYHGGMKAVTGLSILRGITEIESKLESIKWPFLIIHGCQDKIVPSLGSKTMNAKAASEDKTLMMVENCFHQPHAELEPVKTEVFTTLLDWLDKHAD